MPYKLGNGGEGQEQYDPNTGKYVADGKPNSSYDNPQENKILNSMGLEKEDIHINYKNSNLDNIFIEEKIKDDLKKSYDKLIDGDNSRIHAYKEWANNSNDDYKKYIYEDLKNGKKKETLKIWYNHYKLKSGNFNVSFENFLNTPIKLYRATNIDEKDSFTNPFFSYATNKKDAERFLSETQNLYQGRTGEIEEIEIKPIETFGMFPSDENEIIIPNSNYQKLEKKIENIFSIAEKEGVKLPYNYEKLFKMYIDRKTPGKFNILDTMINKYIQNNKEAK